MLPHQPNSKVELRISCSGLKNLDLVSKSDPQVFLAEQRGSEWKFIGSTEKLKNNLDPNFQVAIKLDYYFEYFQNLRFVAMDIDKEVKVLKDIDGHDLIGEAIVPLGYILSQPGRTHVMNLKKGDETTGKIRIHAEEIVSSDYSFYFNLEGTAFDKKDTFGKSDPYFKVTKSSSSGFLTVYQSEVKKVTLDPDYKNVRIKLEELTGGDMKKEIKFEFYDWDKVGDHDFIGSFTTNVQEILDGQRTFGLSNPKKFNIQGYRNSGSVTFIEPRIAKEDTFLDFLAGGAEISLMVGVDFTASNGNQAGMNSLHYVSPTYGNLNPYQKTIETVGSVLAPYDHDGLIEPYGFGAQLPGRPEVNHCFPFSLNEKDNSYNGIQNVMYAYNNIIKKVTLSGPTHFAPLIQRASRKVESESREKYTILLIITDGEICDYDETVDAIVQASKLGLSIVIVGVGKASFKNMEDLDGDDSKLKSGSKKASRDIVQFVPFNKYGENIHRLAEETLKEIPKQFMAYMKKQGIHAKPPRVYSA